MITRKHIRNMKLCSALLCLSPSPSKKKEKVGQTLGDPVWSQPEGSEWCPHRGKCEAVLDPSPSLLFV